MLDGRNNLLLSLCPLVSCHHMKTTCRRPSKISGKELWSIFLCDILANKTYWKQKYAIWNEATLYL